MGDVVLGQAELSVLYIVPQAIPEFTDIGLVVGLMMMVVIGLRRRCR